MRKQWVKTIKRRGNSDTSEFLIPLKIRSEVMRNGSPENQGRN